MLDQKLEAYAKSGIYPFHMPGHKRMPLPAPDAYSIDITEIDGFDDLHHADGILKESMERAAGLYGAKKSYYLVNGSTCGILAAISAAVPQGGGILMARNAHKSAYHAAYLRNLSTAYLNPVRTEFGIFGAVRPDEVEEALQKIPGIRAVLITSPTYEGVVSDVAQIAEISHAHKIPLIVDEAHGAHFGFHPAFPQTAVRLGADIVIESMHKTLPSLTQTALLHVSSDAVSPEAVDFFINIYETSSPSYVLLAGMDRCISLLSGRGEELFSTYYERLSSFYRSAEGLKKLHVMQKTDFSRREIFDLDLSKIVISTRNTNLTGEDVYQKLRLDYRLQMEFSAGPYVLGMTGIMDRDEGFRRLLDALFEIDGAASFEKGRVQEWTKQLYMPKKKRMQMHEAKRRPARRVSYDEAIGQISAAMAYLYPPGIPILLPGEEIDGNLIKIIRASAGIRQNLRGIADIINEKIDIVNL